MSVPRDLPPAVPPLLIEDRISAQYPGLSPAMRAAADYVAANPVDIATRSLRAVAGSSGLSPATFSRLARVLGFAGYEDMREAGRAGLGARLQPFSQRASDLRAGDRDAGDLLHRQTQACIANIAFLDQAATAGRLERIADALSRANTVLLVGSMGSAGLVQQFGYQARWFARNWHIAGENGVSPAAMLTQMCAGDAVLALTKTPYAARTVHALRAARKKGLVTIAITDSHRAPVLQYADHHIAVPTDSPNFFSSYAATTVLLEAVISILVAKSGPEAEQSIRETEDRMRDLGENWPD